VSSWQDLFHGQYVQVWGVLFICDLADVDKNPKELTTLSGNGCGLTYKAWFSPRSVHESKSQCDVQIYGVSSPPIHCTGYRAPSSQEERTHSWQPSW